MGNILGPFVLIVPNVGLLVILTTSRSESWAPSQVKNGPEREMNKQQRYSLNLDLNANQERPTVGRVGGVPV